MFPRQKLFFQNLRQRLVRHPPVQHLFHFHIPTRNRIAHHHQIRRRRQILRIKRRCKRYPQLLQQRRSRRIHSRIRPRHRIPPLAQHPSQRRHSRPANPNHMYPPSFFTQPHPPRATSCPPPLQG